MKDVVQLRQRSTDELRKRLEDINRSLLKERGNVKAGKNQGAKKNPMYYGKLRRDKARILTILRERELNLKR